MKVRNGFVSNSSSSSFTCDVCGEDVSGWDLCLREAEMSECVNGHVVCDGHLLESEEDYEEMTFQEKKEYCLRLAEWSGTKERIGEIEDEDELDDLYSDEIESEERYNVSASRCPCCSLTNPTTEQVLQYLLHEKGGTREDVEDEMRTRFADYDEMLEQIKS